MALNCKMSASPLKWRPIVEDQCLNLIRDKHPVSEIKKGFRCNINFKLVTIRLK